MYKKEVGDCQPFTFLNMCKGCFKLEDNLESLNIQILKKTRKITKVATNKKALNNKASSKQLTNMTMMVNNQRIVALKNYNLMASKWQQQYIWTNTRTTSAANIIVV